MRETAHAWIDSSGAPLYIIHYPASRRDADVVAAHEAIRAIYESTDRPVAWVVDASDVRDAPATQRRIVGEHEQRVRPLAERRCAGLAVVLPNPIVRGFFTAVTWFAPLTYPHRIFETRAEALAWARAQLAARPATLQHRSCLETRTTGREPQRRGERFHPHGSPGRAVTI